MLGYKQWLCEKEEQMNSAFSDTLTIRRVQHNFGAHSRKDAVRRQSKAQHNYTLKF